MRLGLIIRITYFDVRSVCSFDGLSHFVIEFLILLSDKIFSKFLIFSHKFFGNLQSLEVKPWMNQAAALSLPRSSILLLFMSKGAVNTEKPFLANHLNSKWPSNMGKTKNHTLCLDERMTTLFQNFP